MVALSSTPKVLKAKCGGECDEPKILEPRTAKLRFYAHRGHDSANDNDGRDGSCFCAPVRWTGDFLA